MSLDKESPLPVTRCPDLPPAVSEFPITERRLFKPHASAVQTVSCTRDSCFVFEFPADAAFFARDGSTLVLLFEDGASIRLQDFYIVYSREELPSFATDGAEIPGARFLAGLGNPELMPADRASGPEVWNGSFQVLEAAALMDGMDRQDGLGDGPVPDGQSWQSRQAWESWESWQPLDELHAFTTRGRDGRDDGEERVNHGITLTADVPGALDPDIPVRPVHPGDPETPGDMGQSASGSSVLSVSETDLGDGTLPSASGSMHIAALDGVRQIAIGGIAIFEGGHAVLDAHGAPVKIQTGEGYLTAAYDPATGLLNYTYILTSSAQESGLQGADAFARSLKVTVTDMNGDTASCTISIVIEDDVYTAVSDSASFREGEDLQVTGNVVSDDAGKDTPGADGLARVEWKTDNLANGYVLAWQEEGGCTVSLGEEVIGTLTLGPDGSYCFALVQGADVPQAGLPDLVLGYRAFDRDGDYAESTLTITMTGDTRTPDVTGTSQATGEADIVVDEGDQPEHGGEAHIQSGEGSFTVNLHGEDGTIEVGGFTINIVDGDARTTESGSRPSAYGVILSGVYASQEDDTWIVHYQYSYDPDSAGQTHGGENSPTDASLKGQFLIRVTDATGDVTTSTLSVDVHDDVLVASEVSEVVQEGTNSTVSGTVIDNEHAGADGLDRVEWKTDDLASGYVLTLKEEGGYTVSLGEKPVGTLTLGQDGSYAFALDSGYDVTEQTPELVIEYSALDGDGDAADGQLTIDISPDTRKPVIADPESLTVSEAFLPGGSKYNGDENKARTEGEFSVHTCGESSTLTITGRESVDIYLDAEGNYHGEEVIVHTIYGTLTVTSVEQRTVHYTYELAEVPKEDGVAQDTLAIRVEDATHDTEEATLTINIEDDVYTAKDDRVEYTEGEPWQVSGNVVTEGDGRDTPGADALGHVEWKTEGLANGYTLTPQDSSYAVFLWGEPVGILMLDEQGHYAFTLNSDYNVTDQTPELVIKYSGIDGDGNAGDAKLTIDISPDTRKPEMHILDCPEVSEAFLPQGSAFDGTTGKTRTEGEFQVVTYGESSTLYIRNKEIYIDNNGNYCGESVTIDTDYGILTVTHIDNGIVFYTYELTEDLKDSRPSLISDDIIIKIEDATHDWREALLRINIDDDVYTAMDDRVEYTEGEPWQVSGNVVNNDMPGADELGHVEWKTDGLANGYTLTPLGNNSYTVTLGIKSVGILTLDAEGNYAFTQYSFYDVTEQTSDLVIGYIGYDGDGDAADAQLIIDISPDMRKPVIEGLESLTITKENFDVKGSFTVKTDGESCELGIGGLSLYGVHLDEEGNCHEGYFTVQTRYGTFTVTSINKGVVEYTYTLNENQTEYFGDDSIFIYVEDNTHDEIETTLTINIDHEAFTAMHDSVRLAEGESLHAPGEAVTDDVPGTDGLDRLDWLDEANSEYTLEEDRGLRDGVQGDALTQDCSPACLGVQENSCWYADKGEAVPAMESGVEQASVALFLANEAYAETAAAQTSHADEASALEALWLDDADTGSLLEGRAWMEEESAAEVLLLAGEHVPATESDRMNLPDHAPGAESAGEAAMDSMDDDDFLFTVLDGDIIADSSAAFEGGSGSDFMVSSLNERSLETLLAENSHNDHSGQRANRADVLAEGQDVLGLASLTSMGQLAREYGIPLESAASGTRSPDASSWQENESLACSPHSDADLTLETSPDPASFAGCAEGDIQAFILANALA